MREGVGEKIIEDGTYNDDFAVGALVAKETGRATTSRISASSRASEIGLPRFHASTTCSFGWWLVAGADLF
jgi:hypothetical protein